MKYIIFDLDNTLYPKEIGLFDRVNERINKYLVEEMEFDSSSVDGVRSRYLKQYGTTLRGLLMHHNVDPTDYLEYVHDVDIDRLIKRDKRLDEFLEKIKSEKIIFTNGSRDYAIEVLEALGIRGHFSHIFDIVAMKYIAKPNHASYEALINFLNTKGNSCIYMDDIEANLMPAKKLGMVTVLIGKKDGKGEFVDFSALNIIDLEETFVEKGYLLSGS